MHTYGCVRACSESYIYSFLISSIIWISSKGQVNWASETVSTGQTPSTASKINAESHWMVLGAWRHSYVHACVSTYMHARIHAPQQIDMYMRMCLNCECSCRHQTAVTKDPCFLGPLLPHRILATSDGQMSWCSVPCSGVTCCNVVR